MTGLPYTSLANNNFLQLRFALGQTTADRTDPIAISYGVAYDSRNILDIAGPTYTEIGRP